jgi:hypothetical protein
LKCENEKKRLETNANNADGYINKISEEIKKVLQLFEDIPSEPNRSTVGMNEDDGEL